MKSISLKLKDQIILETEEILTSMNTSRNKYINDAVAFYNKIQKRKILQKQLIEESKMVAQDSMEVLNQFELLMDEL